MILKKEAKVNGVLLRRCKPIFVFGCARCKYLKNDHRECVVIKLYQYCLRVKFSYYAPKEETNNPV